MARLVYDFSLYSGVKVVVSPYVGDNHIVLHGPEEKLKPLGIKRKLSVWNLIDGTISGNCEPDEVQVIHLSEKNKAVLESYIESGKKIRQ